MNNTWARGFVAVSVVVGLAGCGTSGASCPAVTSEFLPTATSGQTIEVDLANVYSECNDQGELTISGPSPVATIELVSIDTREKVLATGKSTAAKDGTATVELTIPSDEAGTISVMYEGVSLGTVTVTR
jgi:hypothetical protein